MHFTMQYETQNIAEHVANVNHQVGGGHAHTLK